MQGYPRVTKCIDCPNEFSALCPRHKRCGNWKIKTGCAGEARRRKDLRHSHQQSLARKEKYRIKKEKAKSTMDALLLSRSSSEKKKGEIHICICGKHFYLTPSFLVSKTPSCSYKCMGIRKQKEKVSIVCFFCKKQYKVHSSTLKWNDIRGHKKNHCSKKCKTSSYTAALHPNWIKDRSSLRGRRAIGNAQQREWRKAVFERDNYTCQGCNQRGGELQADHELPFSLYPELRTEILNGRTFCLKCHNKYGWRPKKVDWLLENELAKLQSSV